MNHVNDISANTYQLLAMRTAKPRCRKLANAGLGLAGEAGEVADVWKKVKYMGLEYNAETREKLIKELGDVCWYLMSAATALEIPFDEIINRNIEKLKARHPHGFSNAYMQQKKGA